jgi:glycosyltransferase involved in cell wall biosynthesis
MRIVHVASRSQRRGAERVAIELAEELDGLGHENTIVSLVRGLDGTEDEALPAFVPSASLHWPARAIGAWRLGRYIDRERPDVVLAHGGSAAQATVVSAARHRPAIVWQQILPFPRKIRTQPRRAAWRSVARAIDGSITLTNEAAQDMRSLGYEGPIWVIPNFRRPQRFTLVDRVAAASDLRSMVGVAPSTPLIGFVGYLVEQKRPERALDVLAGVRRAGVDAHLVIAGDGPRRPSVEGLIKESNLESHVTLLGHRDDVEHIFGGLDVAIMTSDVEGIPGVAIEAAMAGCPFVTFPAGNVDEVVDHAVTGIVLERPDTRLMAEHVTDLLRDDKRRAQMATDARLRSHRFAAPERANAYADALLHSHAAHLGGARRQRSSGPVVEPEPMPRVSVVIPTRDRCDLVMRAVKSALDQSCPPLEIIVVDDGSEDGTPDVIKALESDAVKLIVRPAPGGPSAARNDGIACAKGDLLCFLDSDDEWMRDKLATILGFVEGRRAGLTCSSFEVQREDSARQATPGVCKRGSALDRLLHLKGGPLTASVFAVDRAVIDAGIRFDTSFPALNDLDFALQVARAGFPVTGSRRVLVRKYSRSDELRVFRPANEIPARRLMLEKYAELLATRPVARARQQQRLAYALYRTGERAEAEHVLVHSLHEDGRVWATHTLLWSMRTGPWCYYTATRLLHLESGVVGTLKSRLREATVSLWHRPSRRHARFETSKYDARDLDTR